MLDEVKDGYIEIDETTRDSIEEFKDISDKFTSYLDTYSSILERILSDGIPSGKVHNNLEKFLESVNELKNQIGDIADKAQKCSNDFVDDMDKADGYLY